MKKETSALDLYYLTKEFQVLNGARLNKVYQKDKDFLFDFHKTGEGKIQLRIILPNFAFLTKYKDNYESLPKYGEFLRKRINGSFVKEIKQKDFERILEIKFETKDETYILIAELFSKGNLILCDKDYKIIYPLQPQSWQSRTIRGGTTYEYPPEQTNPLSLSKEDFQNLINKSEMDSIVKFLATECSLSGFYAEELCSRAKLDKDKSPGELGKPAMKELFEKLQGMLNEKINANVTEKTIAPFRVSSEGKSYKSFNEAIDETISNKLNKETFVAKQDIFNKKVEKVKHIIKEQEESIKKMESDAIENQRKAELIFEKYQELTELLSNFNKDREEMSWDEIKEKYANHEILKQINEKQGLIVVDL